MLELWTGLSPELQTTIIGVVAGALLYVVQRLWTDCPLLPLLGPDSTTQRKRVAAIILAAIAGVVAIGGDWSRWQEAVSVALGAFVASQGAFLLAKKPEPEEAE